MSLRDKARQLLVVGFGGTTAPGHLLRTLHPGGLIYFSGNLATRQQIRRLSARSQHIARRVSEPLLLMTDQEGGIVTRIPGTSGAPGGSEFDGDARWARHTAVRTGKLLRRLGINVDLAPIADVNTVGDRGVIGPRSFSSNPGVVSRLVSAQICGYHRAGIAATAKHFPGHGSTTTDSHLTTAVIQESRRTWRHVDRRPFVAARRHHVDLVMVGHLALPAIDHSGRPASISPTLDRRLLRRSIGFHGVVITDALNMGGVTSWGPPGKIAVEAVRAGADLLLMPPSASAAVRAIVRAVHSGRLTRSRLNASVTRILLLKKRLGLFAAAEHQPSC